MLQDFHSFHKVFNRLCNDMLRGKLAFLVHIKSVKKFIFADFHNLFPPGKYPQPERKEARTAGAGPPEVL